MRPAPRRLAALLLFPALVLAACGGSTAGSTSVTSSSGARTTKSGLVVTGGFGVKPAVTVPATADPKALTTETLVQGSGPEVKKGDTIVVNYLGQTWKTKSGKADVFDNSYDHKQPIGFQIGTGKVIPGWDKALVGLKGGSRVVLSIPAALAYGATPASSGQPAGALVFVVDVIGRIDPSATASGTQVTTGLPAGLPKIDSQSGKEPAIASVSGVQAPAKGKPAVTAVLLKGDGAPIDPSKTLAVQIVQTDLATGKKTEKTFGEAHGGPQIVPASQVISTIPALKGSSVGTRAVLVTAPTDQGGSLAVVVDVVGQF